MKEETKKILKAAQAVLIEARNSVETDKDLYAKIEELYYGVTDLIDEA